jgi:hypothetical protein
VAALERSISEAAMAALKRSNGKREEKAGGVATAVRLHACARPSSSSLGATWEWIEEGVSVGWIEDGNRCRTPKVAPRACMRGGRYSGSDDVWA